MIYNEILFSKKKLQAVHENKSHRCNQRDQEHTLCFPLCAVCQQAKLNCNFRCKYKGIYIRQNPLKS